MIDSLFLRAPVGSVPKNISRTPLRAGLVARATLGAMAVLLAPPAARASDVFAPASEPDSEATAPAAYAPAEAATTADAGRSHFELGGNLGYTTPPIRGGTTPFGAGLGGRFGLAFSNVYIGANVVGYLGGSDIDIRDRSVMYGMQLGYGFRLHVLGGTFLVVRPQVGAGGVSIFHTDPSASVGATPATTSSGRGGRGRPDVVSSASGSSGGASDTTTVTNVYVEPAVSTMVTAGRAFVGLIGSVVVVPGIAYSGAEATTWVSYGVHGQVGLWF